MSTLSPPKIGSFKVASAISNRWLTIGDTLDNDIHWTVNYYGSAVFNYRSFRKMLRENPWLEDGEFILIECSR